MKSIAIAIGCTNTVFAVLLWALIRWLSGAWQDVALFVVCMTAVHMLALAVLQGMARP